MRNRKESSKVEKTVKKKLDNYFLNNNYNIKKCNEKNKRTCSICDNKEIYESNREHIIIGIEKILNDTYKISFCLKIEDNSNSIDSVFKTDLDYKIENITVHFDDTYFCNGYIINTNSRYHDIKAKEIIDAYSKIYEKISKKNILKKKN